MGQPRLPWRGVVCGPGPGLTLRTFQGKSGCGTMGRKPTGWGKGWAWLRVPLHLSGAQAPGEGLLGL